MAQGIALAADRYARHPAAQLSVHAVNLAVQRPAYKNFLCVSVPMCHGVEAISEDPHDTMRRWVTTSVASLALLAFLCAT